MVREGRAWELLNYPRAPPQRLDERPPHELSGVVNQCVLACSGWMKDSSTSSVFTKKSTMGKLAPAPVQKTMDRVCPRDEIL